MFRKKICLIYVTHYVHKINSVGGYGQFCEKKTWFFGINNFNFNLCKFCEPGRQFYVLKIYSDFQKEVVISSVYIYSVMFVQWLFPERLSFMGIE